METAALSDPEMGYLQYFGLDRNPFPVAPDDENFFISSHIEQVLAEIIHGFVARKGFMVLSGDTGLGKTSISRRILRILEEKQIDTSLVFHTSCRNVELLREINRDFGLQVDSLRLGDLLNALHHFLADRNQNNRNCAIIVDDAQNLDQKSLELIRMISNFEADQRKLVQILLIGQPELIDKLNQPELRQLKSRIIIWQNVSPLLPLELESYLYFKLNLSGSAGQINISKSAAKAVYKHTGGNLRRVNILLDRCLYAAFLEDTTTISRSIVATAYNDLHTDIKHPANRTIKPLGVLSCLILVLFIILQSHYSGWMTDRAAVFLSAFPSPVKELVHAKKPLVSEIQTVPVIPPILSGSLPELKNPHQLLPVQNPPPPPTLVTLFLHAYRLSDYESQFVEAIQNNDFHHLSQMLYKKTGYHLIRLKYLPQSVRGKYHILIHRKAANDQKEYLLLWQPEHTIHDFYYGYRGDEIVALQNSLQRFSLYGSQLDGIVGKNVLKGIIAFQKKWNLPVTGYPDTNTLFLLYNLKGSEYVGKTPKKISG